MGFVKGFPIKTLMEILKDFPMKTLMDFVKDFHWKFLTVKHSKKDSTMAK